jgi:hypothetical protein
MIAEVIEKIRTAEFGNRDLDADFMEALGYRVVRTAPSHRGNAWKYLSAEYGARHWYAIPHVTTSFDDAVRRLPEGALVMMILYDPTDAIMRVSVMTRGGRVVGGEVRCTGGPVAHHEAMVRALCIASLNARAHA